MTPGLMKICKIAEYLGVSAARARVLLERMGVTPIHDAPQIWRKADIDRALGYDVAAPATKPEPKVVMVQVCKSVSVPEDQHAKIKSFAEGMGLEVRELAAQLLIEMVEKKTNGECATEGTRSPMLQQ